MQWNAQLFMVVTVLTAGLLGLLGLLVIYIARGVSNSKQIADMLRLIARIEKRVEATSPPEN